MFSGNTILLKISEENNKNRYVKVGANEIYSFITNEHILELISNMGDNMIRFCIAIGEENIYFLSPHCNCVKRAKIIDDELLKTKMEILLILLSIILKNMVLIVLKNC